MFWVLVGSFPCGTNLCFRKKIQIIFSPSFYQQSFQEQRNYCLKVLLEYSSEYYCYLCYFISSFLFYISDFPSLLFLVLLKLSLNILLTVSSLFHCFNFQEYFFFSTSILIFKNIHISVFALFPFFFCSYILCFLKIVFLYLFLDVKLYAENSFRSQVVC